MPDTIRREIEERARKAILIRAIFRTENSVIIAGSLLLAAFFPQPLPQTLPWFNTWPWLVLGIAGVSATVWNGLSDPGEAVHARVEIFNNDFDVRLIKNRELRAEFEEVLRRYTDALYICAANQSAMTDSISLQFGEWIENIYFMLFRLQAYQANEEISQISLIRSLEEEIENLEEHLDVAYRVDAARAIYISIQRKTDWKESLENLYDAMTIAQIMVNDSLRNISYYSNNLVTAYAQGRDVREHLRDVSQEIAGELSRMKVMIEKTDSIFNYRARGASAVIKKIETEDVVIAH